MAKKEKEEFFLSNIKRNSLAIGSLGGILSGIHVTRRFSRNPQLLKNVSNFGLAARALGIGTLISISSFGIFVFTISYLLNIRCWDDVRKMAKNSMIKDDGYETGFETINFNGQSIKD